MAVVDVTDLLDKEEGSAFDSDSLMFQAFDDGNVFHYDDSQVTDLDEMFKRYGKARTMEQVLTLPIRSAPWVVRKGRASAAAHTMVQEILSEAANNGGMSTPMNLVIAQMTQAIAYRKAYFEKVFTERKGRVVYDKVAWRPPATCAIQREPKHGAFQGFRQMPIRLEDTDEIKVPAQRAFVYIHGTHRNPMDGTSDFDIAYWCYQTQQKIRYLWYSFLEGQSLPKTIVKAQDETTANRMAKKIVGLRNGGVVGIDQRVDVTPLESSGRGAAEFKAALQWLDAEASNSVLAGFTDLGSTAAQGTGSFALSKDQTDFFLMSRQAVSREMADFINQYLIPDLVRYNFGPDQPSPIFEFGPIAESDATNAINLLQSTAAIPPNQSNVPHEFFGQLVERVAGFLELDTQVVREGIERKAKEAEELAKQQQDNPVAPEVAKMAGAVDAATRAVTKRKVREAPDVRTDS